MRALAPVAVALALRTSDARAQTRLHRSRPGRDRLSEPLGPGPRLDRVRSLLAEHRAEQRSAEGNP